MIQYITEIKRKFRDEYNCKVIGGTEADPAVDVEDGIYPMTINGKLDTVVIKGGKISCCNFLSEDSTEEPDEYESIPPHILESLEAYAKDRRPVGHFLQAILHNDLYETVNRADIPCLKALNKIVIYVTNKLPSDCHGSRDKYRKWINGS
jgi:hypothetical protein